ncbi:hypothetical protein ACFQL1_10625 [Halomicroarcula sp. GCM10025709]|uniref:hypothetical protein n=1 Tax=Halomicroarcula sp. GCM10025709 TaxID=3252669 RepID=UPI003608F20D
MTTTPRSDPHAAVMNTVSGREFRPFDPQPGDVALADIAHGLSNICRCSGQTREFYSVGLHSLYVSRDLAARDATPRVQLYGLLHDAPEAYVSDLVSPVKRHLDRYQEVEGRSSTPSGPPSTSPRRPTPPGNGSTRPTCGCAATNSTRCSRRSSRANRRTCPTTSRPTPTATWPPPSSLAPGT